MKISILTSSNQHPVYPHLKAWAQKNNAELRLDKKDLSGGDVLFLISCGELIGHDIRDLYKKTLVVHASDLPKGRGWSPHIWQIIEGKNKITVTLLEAEDKLDTGKIWHQETMNLDGHELYDEVNEKLFAAEIALMDFAVENFESITPNPQSDENASYYPKRTPDDSRLEITETLEDCFERLRIADPDRYPAFFDHKGQRYKIVLEKMDKKT